jgi:hypothetical protein
MVRRGSGITAGVPAGLPVCCRQVWTLPQKGATFNRPLIEKALARYTHNVMAATNDETLPVILRGSGTAVRYKGGELVLCTQHQLIGIEREKVGLLAEG